MIKNIDYLYLFLRSGFPAFSSLLFAFSFLLFTFNSSAQNVSINADGLAPDSSAMLDVVSTDKGILVPRMTEAQRDAISNPATSLIIYQLNNNPGFYFNAGAPGTPSWVKLISNNELGEPVAISDADGDTKVEVEAISDEDIIRFTVKGSEAVAIDSLGNLTVGNAPTISYHKLSVSTDKIGGGFRLNQETDTAGSEVSFFNNSLFKWSLGSTSDLNALGESFFLYNNDRGVMDLFVDGDNGNLGVGTTNPEGKLHLYGTGPLGSGARLVFGDDYQSTTNQWNSFIGEGGWDSNTDSDILQFHARAGHTFTTGTLNGSNPDTIFNISPFGRVFIGNVDLGQRFNVHSQGNAFTRLHSDTGQVGLWSTSDSSGWAIFSERRDGSLLQQGAVGLFLTNGSGLAWTVTREGKMGIGTPNTPALELSIGPVDDDTGFETNSDGVLSLFTNAIERVTFRDSMVGIGTTLPRKELDVRGSIIASSKPLTSLPIGIDYTLLTNNNGRGLLGVYNGFSSLSLDINALDISFKSGTSNFGNPVHMFLNSLGNLGIGTSTPTQKLDVNGNVVASGSVSVNTTQTHEPLCVGDGAYVVRATSSGYRGAYKIGTNNSSFWCGMASFGTGGTDQGDLRFRTAYGGNAGYRMIIDRAGNITYTGSLTASSDIRFKKDIVPITNALASILKLRGVSYNWNTKAFNEKGFQDTPQIGFIAQEVELLYPELVLTDSEGYKSVDYSKITVVLLQALKEQQAIIEKQKEAAVIQHAQTIELIKKLEMRIKILESEK